jgi:YjbR
MAAAYRRIALSLPGASEGAHGGHPDFRVGGRIFCTLAYQNEGYGVLMLTPEQQAGMVEDAPEVFSPVPGGWGRVGAGGGGWGRVGADGNDPGSAGCGERRCA